MWVSLSTVLSLPRDRTVSFSSTIPRTRHSACDKARPVQLWENPLPLAQAPHGQKRKSVGRETLCINSRAVAQILHNPANHTACGAVLLRAGLQSHTRSLFWLPEGTWSSWARHCLLSRAVPDWNIILLMEIRTETSHLAIRHKEQACAFLLAWFRLHTELWALWPSPTSQALKELAPESHRLVKLNSSESHILLPLVHLSSLHLFVLLVAQLCPTLCDPMDYSPPGSSVQGMNFPGKNTGVGHHGLLQGIVPTQGSNSRILRPLHGQAGSLPLCHLGSPLYIWGLLKAHFTATSGSITSSPLPKCSNSHTTESELGSSDDALTITIQSVLTQQIPPRAGSEHGHLLPRVPVHNKQGLMGLALHQHWRVSCPYSFNSLTLI